MFCLVVGLSGSGALTTSGQFSLVRTRSTLTMTYAGRPRIIQGHIGDLYRRLDQDGVDKVSISNDMTKVMYHVKEADTTTSGFEKGDDDYTERTFQTNPLVADHILERAEEKHIHTTFVEIPTNPFTTLAEVGLAILGQLTGPLILLALIQFLFARSRGGRGPGGGMMPPFMQAGRQNERENMIKTNVSLASWAGSPEVFEECTEIVSYLKNSTDYERAGADIPRGILLEGPPGTGKTLLAKAIASEADANFISVSGSEFIELYVGLGAAKVRNLFKMARQNAPSIIFIDEIDAVGKQRGSGGPMGGGNDEREQTLNQILAEMDGFTNNEGVLVMAATNRRDTLDAALLRPGRFDRIVNVPLPDRISRRAILGVHVKNKQLEGSINLDAIAESTTGFSGAQLKNLVNEAAIYAARAGNTTITQTNIEDALEKTVVGIIRKTDIRSSDARRRVAVHELGHAFVAKQFPQYFNLTKVTIQSTYQGAGGYTLFSDRPEIAESGLYTKDCLRQRLAIIMGGKAAEVVYYGEDHVSVGAIQDLKEANDLARRMIGNYGMGEYLEVFSNEQMAGGQGGWNNPVGEDTKRIFDREVLEIVKEAYRDAMRIILSNKDRVDWLVARLLNETTLYSSDF